MPADVIAQAFWRSCRVLPSLRMVEDLLAACGIIDCHKTVRRCAETFGRDSTNQIRRRAPQLHDTWHPDDGVIPQRPVALAMARGGSRRLRAGRSG
jgi:putative transposase